MKSLLKSICEVVSSIEAAEGVEKSIRYACACVLFDQLKREISASNVDMKPNALECLGYSLELLKEAVFPVEADVKSLPDGIQSSLLQLGKVRYYMA